MLLNPLKILVANIVIAFFFFPFPESLFFLSEPADRPKSIHI